MLELEGLRVSPVHPPVKANQPPVKASGPSHGGDGQPAPRIQDTQRRFSSDDDEWVGPRIGIVRKGRRGGRPVRRNARRPSANPFVQFEAEEGDDEETGSELESSPRAAPAHRTQTSHTSDSDSDSNDLDDSFVVGDESFE